MHALEVKKVAGDGDCLFHALGAFDGYDGAALRIEVVGYMEVHAMEQEGFEEKWLTEARKLRDSQWGGHTAIAAYSLMTSRRVVLHTRGGNMEMPKVKEMSHAEVFGKEDYDVVHILYNNLDHYDALIQIRSLEDMVPAWAQPAPSLYFVAKEAAENFPALTSDKPANSSKTAFTAPRPPKKGKPPKQKATTAAAKPSKGKPAGKRPKATGQAEAAPIANHPTPAPKAARKSAAKKKAAAKPNHTKKQQPQQPREISPPADTNDAPGTNEYQAKKEEEQEEEERPGLMEDLQAIPVAETSKHPHRKAEDLIQD